MKILEILYMITNQYIENSSHDVNAPLKVPRSSWFRACALRDDKSTDAYIYSVGGKILKGKTKWIKKVVVKIK